METMINNILKAYNLNNIEKSILLLTKIENKTYINHIVDYIYENKYETIFEQIKNNDNNKSFIDILIKNYTLPSIEQMFKSIQ